MMGRAAFEDARRLSWPALLTLRQNRSRLARASSGPPWAKPDARRTAFMVPALAPLTASKVMVSSWSSRSSTPQVNAPKEPPPCSASERRLIGLRAGFGHERRERAFALLGRSTLVVLGTVMVCPSGRGFVGVGLIPRPC